MRTRKLVALFMIMAFGLVAVSQAKAEMPFPDTLSCYAYKYARVNPQMRKVVLSVKDWVVTIKNSAFGNGEFDVIRRGIQDGDYFYVVGDEENEAEFFVLRVNVLNGEAGIYGADGSGSADPYLFCRDN